MATYSFSPSPRKKPAPKQAESDSEEETVQTKAQDDGEEVLLVGGADEMGGYDEENFQEQD